MAGIENKIIYGQGFKLQPSGADDIARMQNTDSASFVNYNATPETAVSANIGSISIDRVAGNLYIKQTGTGNTGWSLLAALNSAPTFTGNVTSLTRVIAPYDTGAGEGFYFSDGTVAAMQVGSARANYFFGRAGNSTLTSIANTGVGQAALASLTGGLQNTGMGNGALVGVTDGSGNCGYGLLSGSGITTGVNNCAYGVGVLSISAGSSYNNGYGVLALQQCTGQYNNAFGNSALQNVTGDQNTALGGGAGAALLHGQKSLFLGYLAGSNCTSSESNNILIDNAGVNSESDTTRIGTSQANCAIAGIYGNYFGSSEMVTVDSSGNMGSQAIPSGGLAPQFQTGAVVASLQTAVTIPFICSNPCGGITGTVNISNTSMYLIPIYLDENKTYTALGCAVSSVAGAGSAIDFVLYDNTGAGGLPGNLVASAVNVPSTIASITEGSISFSANVGWYWIGIQRNATATVTLRGYSNGDAFSSFTNKAFYNPANLAGDIFTTIGFCGATNTYGTYPNSPTLTQNNPTNTIPLLYIR